MDQIHAVRARALDIYKMGVAAANPAALVRSALDDLPMAAPTILLAVGKAACDMMAAALERVEPKQAIVVTNYENAREVKGAEVLSAGHPRPDDRGLAAGQRVKAIVAAAGAGDRILLLLSGGGSALLPCPIAGVNLTDKQTANDLMLGGGVPIDQINLVRQNLSQLKGGGLAALAAPASVRALILSDVIGDDVRAIASGPTAAPLGTTDQARDVLEQAGLWAQMPISVQRALSAHRPQAPAYLPNGAVNQIIGSNTLAVQAMAAQTGGHMADLALVGDVQDAAAQIVQHIHTHPAPAILWGGETTVRLQGSGRGGRNQELALHVLGRLQHEPGPWAFLSAGSDGIDGPTDAAGGLVDSTMTLGHGDLARLKQNDSYSVLQRLGGLVSVGATGTNVADFQVFVRYD